MLGALFPVTIFTAMFLIFGAPLAPDSLALFERLTIVEGQWQGAAVAFLVVVLAGVLQALSVPILRLYEGYPWKDGWVGQARTRRFAAELGRLEIVTLGIDRLLESELPEQDPRYAAIGRRGSMMDLDRRFKYPERRALVLPTRLGNLIRSAERYPSVEYGIEAIVMWPRLTAVIEPDYAASLDRSRTNLMFMLNNSILALALAVILAALSLTSPDASLSNAALPALAFLGVSVGFYHLALRPAQTWGELIRAAFDLYRRPLLEKLGVPDVPASRAEERALWRRIKSQMLWGDEPGAGPRVDTGPTVVAPAVAPLSRGTWVTASGPALKWARGVRRAGSRTIHVFVQVWNPDDVAEATGVHVWDIPPEGFEYVWASGRVEGAPVSVEGSAPHAFLVARTLLPGANITLRYKARRLVETV